MKEPSAVSNQPSAKPEKPTYELIYDHERVAIAIRCSFCGLTSYNLNDIANRYCGACHIFHEDLSA